MTNAYSKFTIEFNQEFVKEEHDKKQYHDTYMKDTDFRRQVNQEFGSKKFIKP